MADICPKCGGTILTENDVDWLHGPVCVCGKTEIKFTPGPWRTALADDTLILDGDGNEVAGTLGDYDSDYRRMEANAALISAAPDMYEACTKALNYIQNTEREFGITLSSGDALRAALTKARGGK